MVLCFGSAGWDSLPKFFFQVGFLRAREQGEAVKNVISDKKVICDDLAQN